MGGTRTTGTVTLDEVAALAARMTIKLSWASLPIGGAKAGIVCDLPAGEERDRRFAQFGLAISPLLRGGVYLGSDQGTSHRDRDLFLAAAGYDVAEEPILAGLPCKWSQLWERCEDVTGFGVCEGVLSAVEAVVGAGEGRVVVQGFGAVGRAVASRLAAKGYSIVGIADRVGTVTHPAGLPLLTLLAATDPLGTIDRSALPQAIACDRRPDAWLDVDADLLVLAAGGDAIHDGNVDRVRALLVAEGGNLAVTPSAQRTLARRGVPVLPDYIINVGGAAVTGLLLTGQAPLCTVVDDLVEWLYDEIGHRIRRNVDTLLTYVDSGRPLGEIGLELGGPASAKGVPMEHRTDRLAGAPLRRAGAQPGGAGMAVTAAREDLRFDVPSLVADAAAAAEAEPTEFAFLDALDVLAGALDRQARLTATGRAAVRGALVAALCTQARLRRAVARHPEIASTEVTRPVFITGLLRSGTTLVHNLLAQHPGLRVPALWELMHPVSERGDAVFYAGLADAAQAYVEDYYQVAPELPKIHFLDARRPDECHRLTGNTFTTMVYEARYRVPDYTEWLRGVDHTAAYRLHRAQLQAILWRLPGGPVVLKDPFHLWCLPALVAAYPDARIVQLHRDPVVTVPSTCSLCVTIRGARSDEIDRAEIGQQWLAQAERALDALPRVRATALAGVPILDVRYADLVADPIGVLDRVCEFAGAPLTAEAERAMRAYLSDNGATKHGRHEYSAADFGLEEVYLRQRFAAYRHEYGV